MGAPTGQRLSDYRDWEHGEAIFVLAALGSASASGEARPVRVGLLPAAGCHCWYSGLTRRGRAMAIPCHGTVA